MVIVDTTVWIDFLRGTANPESLWLRANAGTVPLGLTDLALCEILQGIPDEASFRAALAHFQLFPIFETGGAALAIEAAKNFRLLRSRGFTVRKTIDCLVATFCIREKLSLLHRDRDFDAFEKVLNLSVIRP